MPPKGDALTPAQIATLTAWIEQGAVWPDGVDTAKLADKRDHWSFKPVAYPAPPEVSDPSWPRNALDRFILTRLEQAGLRPAPEADRVAWLRRVSFDLTGLPPTPEQVEAFLADQRADAYEHAVDELLKSPRYGERWAQHWLDVVRYADTHGFEVNTERPNAWPYRDYVIDAFNDDTPYDRFILEQIAGDAMGVDAATGFLVTASVLLPGQIGKDEPSKRLARQDSLDEIVTNIGQTFLGLTVGCARCHDHKFDPISQTRLLRDAGSLSRRAAWQSAPLRHAGRPKRSAPRGAPANTDRLAKHRSDAAGLRAACARSGIERSGRSRRARDEYRSLRTGAGETLRFTVSPRRKQSATSRASMNSRSSIPPGKRGARGPVRRSVLRRHHGRRAIELAHTSTTARTATNGAGCRTRGRQGMGGGGVSARR